MKKPVLYFILLISLYSLLFSFGKNKIQYKNFHWKQIDIDKFRLYFYKDEKELAEMTTNILNEELPKLQNIFGYNMLNAKPIIIYANHYDFQSTNVAPFFIPEGVGGFHESLKGRIVLPFQGSYHSFRSTLVHELVHSYTFAKIAYYYKKYQLYNYKRMPLWFTEGVAEYFSKGWDPRSDIYLRDVFLNGKVVELPEIRRIMGTYLMYKEGQSIIYYLAETYGEHKIIELLENWYATGNFDKCMKYTYGFGLEELNSEWINYWRKKYFPEVKYYQDIKEVSLRAVKDGFINLSPSIIKSNNEDRFDDAFIYFTNRYGYMEIFIHYADGTEETLVETGYSYDFESIHTFEARADILGDDIIFVARKNEQDAINKLNYRTKELVDVYSFDGLYTIFSPVFSPDGESIAFTAADSRGFVNIYVYRVESNELIRLTNDAYFQQTPVFLDSNTIIYSSDKTHAGATNLFSLSLEDNKEAQLTYGNYVDGQPYIGEDKTIYFTSNRNFYPKPDSLVFAPLNIFSIKNENPANIRQVTNFFSSIFNFDINKDIIYATILDKHKYDIYKFKMDSVQVESQPEQPKFAYKFKRSSLSESEEYEKDYSLDMLSSSFSYNPLLGLGGGSNIALSDILGNERYYFFMGTNASTADEFFENLDVITSYQNLEHRLNYAFTGFHILDNYSLDTDWEYTQERKAGAAAYVNFPLDKFRRLESSIITYYRTKDSFIEGHDKEDVVVLPNFSYVVDRSQPWVEGPIEGTRFNFTVGHLYNVKEMFFENSVFVFDYRRYFRTSFRTAIAQRILMESSIGNEPMNFYLGGSYTMRGYSFRHFKGSTAFLFSNEFRFPLLENIGLHFFFGQMNFPRIRGAIFFDMGNAGDKFKSVMNNLHGSFGFGWRVNMMNVTCLRFDFARRTDFSSVTKDFRFQFFVGWSF